MTKYPWIPRKYYPAVMYACRIIREHKAWNVAIETAARLYQVDKATLADIIRKRQAAGGYIESFTIAKDLVVLCDEEGWLKMKKPNCKIFGNLFVGTIIFVGVDGEEFTDCPITAEELNSPPWDGLLEEV